MLTYIILLSDLLQQEYQLFDGSFHCKVLSTMPATFCSSNSPQDNNELCLKPTILMQNDEQTTAYSY